MGFPLFIGAVGAALVGWALAGRASRVAAANEGRRRREDAPPRGRIPSSVQPSATRANDRTSDPSDPPTAPTSPIWPGWPTAPVPSSDDGTGRTREHAAADDDAADADPGGAVAPPGLDEWASTLAPLCLAAGIQLPYALQWVSMESGGNPCQIGYPPSKGPDGAPLEMGIGQFYNPDDLKALRLTSSELRAYCVPGDQHEVTFNGRRVRGFSSRMSRPMTPEERIVQARGQVGLITKSMADATRLLTRIGAGPDWSPTRQDFWRLVKLAHGMPSLLSEGWPRINAKLGRPPVDWAEYKRMLGEVTLGARTEEKRRKGLVEAALDNAERCANVFTERAIA